MKSFMEVLFNDKYRSLFYRLSAALALLVLLAVLGMRRASFRITSNIWNKRAAPMPPLN
jgi:hypothetical protein